jgi:hypothetical protein
MRIKELFAWLLFTFAVTSSIAIGVKRGVVLAASPDSLNIMDEVLIRSIYYSLISLAWYGWWKLK